MLVINWLQNFAGLSTKDTATIFDCDMMTN